MTTVNIVKNVIMNALCGFTKYILLTVITGYTSFHAVVISYSLYTTRQFNNLTFFYYLEKTRYEKHVCNLIKCIWLIKYIVKTEILVRIIFRNVMETIKCLNFFNINVYKKMR